MRPQFARIEIHLHLPLLAAERIGNRRAGNGGQLRAQDVLAEIEDLLFRNRLARQRQLQNRNTRGVVRQDERRGGAGRRGLQLRLRHRDDLRERQILVHVRLEEVFDDRCAIDRLGFGVFDVVDHGLRAALGGQHDAIGDFVRQQTVVAPDHRGDGDLDVRENIRGGAQNRVHAQKDDERSQHQKRIGTLQSDSDDPHQGLQWVERTAGRGHAALDFPRR